MEKIEEELKTASELYENGKFFEASFHYRGILKDIKGKKMPKETIDLIKNRLKESILNSENHIKEYPIEVPLDRVKIEQVNNNILKKIGNDFSILITLSHCFLESVENIEKTLKEAPFSISKLCSSFTYTDEGYLCADSNDYKHIELELFKNYEIIQKVKVLLYINPILRRLIENKVFDLSSFELVLKNKGLCPTDNELLVLKHGIRIYLEKDFTSALHILVPQFENLFLMISEEAGIQTTAIERGKTATKKITLSDSNLESEEMIKIFEKDYCFYLRYLLYSPLGLSIRHKIAHGTINNTECNETNCNLVLIGFFILLNKV
jgi:hypothetical protein